MSHGERLERQESIFVDKMTRWQTDKLTWCQATSPTCVGNMYAVSHWHSPATCLAKHSKRSTHAGPQRLPATDLTAAEQSKPECSRATRVESIKLAMHSLPRISMHAKASRGSADKAAFHQHCLETRTTTQVRTGTCQSGLPTNRRGHRTRFHIV